MIHEGGKGRVVFIKVVVGGGGHGVDCTWRGAGAWYLCQVVVGDGGARRGG